jgi:OFA family oxalate/formate antiporter-like MFS transporter
LVILSGLAFFAWDEIYALLLALGADIQGKNFATANYGLLYTAMGTAALVVPLANLLPAGTGGWTLVFLIAAVLDSPRAPAAARDTGRSALRSAWAGRQSEP